MNSDSTYRLIDVETLNPIAVPNGVTSVVCKEGRDLEVVESTDGEMRLEPLVRGGKPLLACYARSSFTVNGVCRPNFTLLSEGDLVRIGTAFWVSRWLSPIIKRAAPESRVKCPLCRTSVADHDTLVCECGGLYHHGGELACSDAINECVACKRAFVRERHYTFAPEGFQPPQEKGEA